MQGLTAARPQATQNPQNAGAQDPKHLIQAAGSILEQAVSQFGPQIIEILKQILTGPPPGAGSQGSPQGGGAMMSPGIM